MSQQINLLNPALIKQKDLLNLNTIAISLGLLLAMMLAYDGYAHKKLSSLTLQRSEVSAQLLATQAQLKQVATLHAPRELDKALLTQIEQLEQQEKMQQQVLQTVSLSSATPDKGYAALMRGFAKQSLESLWLTSFSINSSNDQLNISGRTTQADLVPEYIARLSNEPALKGKSFSALNMHLNKLEVAPTNKTSALADTISPIAPSAANALIKNNQTATPVNQNPKTAKEAQYIEFNLQSIDDKSTLTAPNAVAPTKDGGKS